MAFDPKKYGLVEVGAPSAPDASMDDAAATPPRSPLHAAVQAVESGGNDNAVSPKGAVGPMQTMPATLADPGYGVAPAANQTVSEQRRVGDDYLDAMGAKYGNQTLALMAYNWGPGNVDRWLASGAKPQDVPQETRDYVLRVNAHMAQNQQSATPPTPPTPSPGGGQSPSDGQPAAFDPAKYGLVEAGSEPQQPENPDLPTGPAATFNETMRRFERGALGPLAGPVSRLTGGAIAGEAPEGQIPEAAGRAAEYAGLGGSLALGGVRAGAALVDRALGGAQAGLEVGTAAAKALADQGGRVLGNLQRLAVDAYHVAQTNPGAFWGLELGTSAAAGAAGGAVQAAGGSPTQQTLAELGAGGAVAVPSTVRAAVSLLKKTPTVGLVYSGARRMLGFGPTESDVGKAGARIASQAVPNPETPIRSPSEIREALKPTGEFTPGVDLTAGEKSQNPGIMALEQRLVKDDEVLSAANKARVAGVVDAVRADIEAQHAGTGAVAAQDYVNHLMDASIVAARVRTDQALQRLGPNVSREDANRLARATLSDYDAAAKLDTQAAWEKVPFETRSDIQNTTKAYQGVLQEQYGDRVAQARNDIPPIVSKMLGQFKRVRVEGSPVIVPGQPLQKPQYVVKWFPGELGQDASVRELQTLRSTLLDKAAEIRASGTPNNRALRVISKLSDSILADMEATPASDALEAARAATRNYEQRFHQGEVGRIFSREPTREDSIAPILTLEATLGQPGMKSVEAADRLMAAANGDPAMKGHIEDFLKDEFLRATTSKGAFDPDAAQAYLAKRQDVLGRFPEVRSQMAAAQQAGDLHALALDNRKPSQNVAALVLNTAPEKLIQRLSVTANPRVAAARVRAQLATDPTGEALTGMKDALIEHILQQAQTNALTESGMHGLSGQRMADTLAKPGVQAMLEAFGDRELALRLERAKITLMAIDRGAKTAPADALNNSRESIYADTLRRIGAAMVGRHLSAALGGGTVQVPSIMVRFASRVADILQRGPVTSLIREALLDHSGQKLEALAMAPTTKAGKRRQAAVLNAWLGAIAVQRGLPPPEPLDAGETE